MTISISELEKVAAGASPGPWHVDEDIRLGMRWNRHIMRGPNNAVCFMAHSGGADEARDEATANHVANMSPATALKLLAVVRAAQKVDQEMKEWNGVPGGPATRALRIALQEFTP